jgi:hypothetical protein
MKHLINWTLALALSCVALLTAATAWAIQPINYESPTTEFRNFPFFDCAEFGMNFTIMADWDFHEYGRMHFDPDGKLVQVNGFYFYSNSRIWNSEEPAKVFGPEDYAGTEGHTHFMVFFDDNEWAVYYRESGIFFRTVIPGYGAVNMRAGLMKFVWNWDLFGWVPVNITPNQQEDESDYYALCELLQ